MGRVGVLLGGLSSERSVSFKSGRAVAEALRSRGYEVVEIDVDYDIDQQLRRESIAIAFPVLHGKWGEDGCIQGLLECLGIPYTGPSVFAASLTMDKVTTLRLLRGAGLPVPEGLLVDRAALDRGELDLSFDLPAIVKPVREGSSYGITRVSQRADLEAAIEQALSLDDRVLVEECLDGPELTVGILGGRDLPVVEIAPAEGWFDFEAKYTRGACEYFVPARIDDALTAEVRAMSLKAAQLTGCTNCARVDVMAGGTRGPRILEINTIPGMTGTSLLPMAAAAEGIDFEEVCHRLVQTAALHNGAPSTD